MAIVTVFTVQVKTEKSFRYEALCARLAAKAVEKNDPDRFSVYQSMAGELGTIHFVMVDENWAGLARRAGPGAIAQRLLGEKEGQRHAEELHECATPLRIEISTDRPDLSYPPEDTTTIRPFAVLTNLRARPGGQQACEELLRKLAEAIPKQGDPGRIITHQTLIGNIGDYWVVRPLANLADLDSQKGPQELLTEAFGAEDGGRILENGQEAVEQVQRSIVVYRPDLSNPATS